MLRKLLLTTVCVAGLSVVGPTLSFAATDGTTAGMTTEQQAALDAQVSAVEALVIQYQNDPAGLDAAVEALVSGASDPEVSANAVLIVFNNSQNPQIQAILAANGALAAAGGRGLGAAIATIALTNPELATKLSANVIASGNSEFTAAVQTGTDTKTASLSENQKEDHSTSDTDVSETPENPASAS